MHQILILRFLSSSYYDTLLTYIDLPSIKIQPFNSIDLDIPIPVFDNTSAISFQE